MVVEVTLGHILGEALGADVMNVPAAYPPDDAIPELTTLEDEPLATYARRLYSKGYREGYAVGHAVARGVIEELPAPYDGSLQLPAASPDEVAAILALERWELIERVDDRYEITLKGCAALRDAC